MDDYQEIYEENNNLEEVRGDYGRYGSQPEYKILKEYYKEYPSGYEKSYITREINSRNNNKIKKQEYYNNYADSYNPENNNYNIPDRIKDWNFFINENRNYNLREDYSYPINKRVNIRKKIYKGSKSPQPYIQNNDLNDQEEEYIDNYQYYETKNIKDNGIKKYDSITHITGYSNLIPLNRMKNLYGKNYNDNEEYQQESKNLDNYKFKIKDKVKELRKGKKQYEEFLKYSNKDREEEKRLEKIRRERLKQEKETRLKKLKKERIEKERKRKEEELKLEKLNQQELEYQRIDNNRNENIISRFRPPIEKYKYKQNISEDIDKYRANPNYNSENISRREIIHKSNKKENKKYSKIPNNIYNKSEINKYYNRINNTKKLRSNRSFQNNSKYKIVNFLNVQQKTANLNYPNQNKKVDTYGENFDESKYKREYTNVEEVDDGRIENHIETGLSKDGQYLISVSSARKIYDDNKNENEEYEEEVDNNNIYEIPEKNVKEIISTVTTKRKNLGDNYKFYESKHLYQPNLTSFTKHRRRTKRTIYGNEEHETREVKTYKIRQDMDEDEEANFEKYGQGRAHENEDYDEVYYNYSQGDREEQPGPYENEEDI